jgi:Ricin-type beta-trefoil lectin domain
MERFLGRILGHGRKMMALAALPAIAATGFMITSAASAQASVASHTASQHVNTPAAAPGTPFASSSFFLVNYNSGLCLGVNDNTNNAGQWDCTGAANQTWHWGAEYGESGYFQLVNGNNRCLGVAAGSTAQGAQVVGWPTCITSHQDQYWEVDTDVTCDGYYPIFNLNSGLVLGISANSTANGEPAVQWNYQGACNNQFWAFVPS